MLGAAVISLEFMYSILSLSFDVPPTRISRLVRLRTKVMMISSMSSRLGYEMRNSGSYTHGTTEI